MGKQMEIAGCEAPKNVDIENAIDQWLEAKDEQKYATEKTRLRHSALLIHMQNAGIDAYPYTDAKTGRKKQVVIARDPKAKTLKAPRPNRRDDDADIGDEVEVRDAELTPLNSDSPPTDEPAVDNVVEMRRVKRTAAHDAVVDPFASTRGAMDAAATWSPLDSAAPADAFSDGAIDSDAPEETQVATKKRKGRR